MCAKKSAASSLSAPFLSLPLVAAEPFESSRACRSLRARQLPAIGRFERVLNEFLRTAACRAASGFALQRNDSSDNSTSFREHFTHNGTFGNKVASPPRETIISQRDCIGTKRLRRIQLESRKQADVHGTLSPWHRSVLAFVFVSQICLFTLSEDPGEPGRTTEVSRR